MARDKDCFVVMTLSGALTVGKMGLIFCDLIESGVVNAIVSTGALMAHGLVEATGRSHFRYDARMNDKMLFEAGYNRVYDSLEPEVNLDHVAEVMQRLLNEWDANDVVCSWKIHRRIGEFLQKHAPGRGILKSAFQHDVPVFVPAFSDSALGIDFALHKIARQKENRPVLRFDPFEDFEKFANTMLATKRMGIFTVGGGVPRNWSQQFGVYAELLARRGYKKLPLKRYNYGLRICPEPVSWGGLSGSTYTEAVSGGKFVPPEEGGRFSEGVMLGEIAVHALVARERQSNARRNEAVRLFGGIFADDRERYLAGLEMLQTFTSGNEFAIGREDGGDANDVARGNARVAQGQLEAGKPFSMFPDTICEEGLLRDKRHGAGFSGLPDRIEGKKIRASQKLTRRFSSVNLFSWLHLNALRNGERRLTDGSMERYSPEIGRAHV